MLLRSPISAITRPSRTRRSAMPRYSSLAFSSVVPSSSKVRLRACRSSSIVFQTLLNSSSTRLGGGANLCLASSSSSSLRLTFCRDMPPCSRAMPLLDHLAELGERFQAERLGELVVERDRLRRLDRLHGDVELGILAGQMRAPDRSAGRSR